MAPTPGDGETATAPHHERPDNSEQNHTLSTSTRADGKPDPINHPTPVPVLKCVRAGSAGPTVATPCPSPRHPNRVQKPARSLETRRSILTRRSKLGGRMLSQPDRLRSRAQRKVLTRRRPGRRLETQLRQRLRLLPRRRSPHESRRGGSGKPNHGRSRGSRPKPSASPSPPPAPHAADPLLAQLAYVIVNEAGASVWTSQIGREELPSSTQRCTARSRSDAGSRGSTSQAS